MVTTVTVAAAVVVFVSVLLSVDVSSSTLSSLVVVEVEKNPTDTLTIKNMIDAKLHLNKFNEYAEPTEEFPELESPFQT